MLLIRFWTTCISYLVEISIKVLKIFASKFGLVVFLLHLVIVESPFAGDVEENIRYARAAVRDSLLRGEAPIASHLLYTQEGILDDNVPEQRKLGIDAGLAWGKVADYTAVYVDRGISSGMWYGIENALKAGRPIYYRSLPDFAQGEELDISSLEDGDVFFAEGDDNDNIVGRVFMKGGELYFTYNGSDFKVEGLSLRVRRLPNPAGG